MIRIHINQHMIRKNTKLDAGFVPMVTVKASKRRNFYGYAVTIHGPAYLRSIWDQSPPGKPLSCGARVWPECDCPVTVHRERPDGNSNEEAAAYGCGVHQLDALLT